VLSNFVDPIDNIVIVTSAEVKSLPKRDLRITEATNGQMGEKQR
jgi:hypothetical protein